MMTPRQKIFTIVTLLVFGFSTFAFCNSQKPITPEDLGTTLPGNANPVTPADIGKTTPDGQPNQGIDGINNSTTPGVNVGVANSVSVGHTTEHLANLEFAKKNFSETEVNNRLNDVIAVQNGLLTQIKDLQYKHQNSSSWSIQIRFDENGDLENAGFGGLLKTRAEIDAILDDIIKRSSEKDPTIKQKIAKLDLNLLKNRVSRLEKIGEVGEFQFLGEMELDNSGLQQFTHDGTTYKCTTEGYLNSTPANENYVVGVSATPGIENAYKFVIGVYYKGDTHVNMMEWPVQFRNIDYMLGVFNISPNRVETRQYYNAIRFGGDHWQGKPFSVLHTVTDEKVHTTSNSPVQANIVKKPQPVVVVNQLNEPVPVITQKN